MHASHDEGFYEIADVTAIENAMDTFQDDYEDDCEDDCEDMIQEILMNTAEDPNIEDFSRYKLGGYYLVDLGDRFDNNCFMVISKLGYGASASVWLARDEVEGTNVALKILTAISSREASELEML